MLVRRCPAGSGQVPAGLAQGEILQNSQIPIPGALEEEQRWAQDTAAGLRAGLALGAGLHGGPAKPWEGESRHGSLWAAWQELRQLGARR